MNIVILAAGAGKRMYSSLPKVLHPLAGRPLLSHVIDTARALDPARLVVVVGHGADQVRAALDKSGASDVLFALQREQLGTGHALQQALPLLDAHAPTLVLYGDVPLIRAGTLRRLIESVEGASGTGSTGSASNTSGTGGTHDTGSTSGTRDTGSTGGAGSENANNESANNENADNESDRKRTGPPNETTGFEATGSAGEPDAARAVKTGGNRRYGLLTVTLDDPTGYGRVVRDAQGKVVRIVEQKDASAAECDIGEVNTGIVILPGADAPEKGSGAPESTPIARWLAALKNDNAQREFYLTDVVGLAKAEGFEIVTAQPDEIWETLGVNSKPQLAGLERIYQRNVADALLAAGVTLADPARIDVRGTLRCARDVSIDVNCVFEGNVTLEQAVTVGPNCVLRDARIGAGTRIDAFTHIDGARVGAHAALGPYARLRPGTQLDDETHVGNFVELKNARVGQGSKANHLAYVGDADVGARVNIGAGTITCNYDGANKHRTVIEDDVFVGSDTQLVAPVRVGRGATIAAGTTVWKDVSAGALALNTRTQAEKPDHARPVKKKN